MKTSSELDEQIKYLGYVRERKLFYRASFSSSEVVHKLLLRVSHRDPDIILGDVFVSGPDELVSRADTAWHKFVGTPSKAGKVSVILAADFLRFDLNNKYSSVGAVSRNPGALEVFMKKVVFPVVQPIDTSEKLYALTVGPDHDVFLWFQPVLRAAQAVFLAQRLGIAKTDTRSQLEEHAQRIERQGEVTDFDDYFEFLWSY